MSGRILEKDLGARYFVAFSKAESLGHPSLRSESTPIKRISALGIAPLWSGAESGGSDSRRILFSMLERFRLSFSRRIVSRLVGDDHFDDKERATCSRQPTRSGAQGIRSLCSSPISLCLSP